MSKTQSALESFDSTMAPLSTAYQMQCAENTLLRQQLDAWETRFPQYEYRSKDDSVALKNAESPRKFDHVVTNGEPV